MAPGVDDELATARISLHGSEERFRLLVEQVTEYAIFLLDTSGRVSSWNLGAARIKGYSAGEIIGQHFSRFYRPEDVWKCAHELEVATREGRVEDEGWRVRKDGSRFWANVVITALRDDSGGLIGFAKVTRDLSERRRTEEALRESEERFRMLVESVTDYAIFRLDPTGHVATWNSGAERIKGYRAGEIIGQHFSRFYPEEDIRAGKCEMELERASLDGRFEDEGWRLRKDGSRFWANVVITALRDPGGELVGFAKVTRDLTERRAAEEERLRLGQLARERMHVLTELSEALSGTYSIDQVAQVVIERATSIAGADTCVLYLLDEPSSALELTAERGLNPELLEDVRRITPESGNPAYPIGAGSGDAIWIETPEQYDEFYPALAQRRFEGARARAFFCVPLIAEGHSIGMLVVGFHEARSFSDDEREFVLTFARQSAQGLARAKRLAKEREAAALAERLRASLSTTLRSIGDALIATDTRGNITLMNGVAEALTGWREHEARGRPLPEVFRIVHEHTRETAQNPAEKVLAHGAVVGLANHTVLIARDGHEVPIDDSGAPIRNEGGSIEGVVLVFRDVTERKREESRRSFLADATSALAESLDYEQTVARVAQLAVPRLADWCAIDLITEGQRAPRRLAVAHVDPAKIQLAQDLASKYPPQPNATRGVSQVLRSGRSELLTEIPDELLVASCVDAEQLRMARELSLHSAMIVPLRARTGVLGAVTFVFAESRRVYGESDVLFAEELAARCALAIENARAYTSEQHARLAADVANRAKDEFLAVVSHELRTPLNAIMGWAQMLTLREMDETRLKRAHETIERNAVAMAQLIEDLLDMSRVISGKLRIEVQRVELARVVEAAIESIRPAVLARDIELVPSIEVALPEITGDPTRLQQIVWNLLSNAVKFTPKGGRVDIALRRIGSSLEISVADTGKGIAPDFLPNVFEPFRQEDAGPSRYRGGLGLGLAISRQLVELHGGQIVAHSGGEGRGARFSVTIPISAAAPASQLAQRTARQFRANSEFDKPEHIRGLRVLVVDDEEDARRLVAMILEDCGCLVTTAGSVSEALRHFSERAPDVLLSDIGMPGENGYDLIRKVRALPHPAGGGVPAAALTAYARPEDRRNMLNAGYSIHLPKPVEAAELVAVVATLSRFIQRG
ncbi:MAG TPA: PAS domain S-box protein [Polyangiales bacterium]|nr:PAS domain S-box protein [Polyangiales bacterium]